MRHACLALAAILTISGSAFAQSADPDCHVVSPTERVVATTLDGTKLFGSLVCLGERDLVLVGGAGRITHPMNDVRRVATRADPVWDGAAKGAVVPLIVWAVLCRSCSASHMLRATATYGLMGLALDAIDTNTRTIYDRRGMAPALRWRVRF